MTTFVIESELDPRKQVISRIIEALSQDTLFCQSQVDAADSCQCPSTSPECVVLWLRYLWLWWSTCVYLIAAYNSMKPGDSLNTKTELCSENSKYCMQFAKMLPARADTSYLRIYLKTTDDWAVWIGNRNQPVDMDSAVLLLDHSGVLKIESKYMESPIILYSSPKPSNNTVATLMDTGNFMLHQLHPDGTKRMLWQSFDYPIDELVPGMKLGIMLEIRVDWERELIIKRRGKLCWRSGALRDNTGIVYNTRYTIVSNDSESSFTIANSNNEQTIWSLLETGQVMNWNGGDVAKANMCFGYNTDNGCQKWDVLPSCRHRGDAFEAKEMYQNQNVQIYELANSALGPTDCLAICWKNCSCDGYQKYYDDGIGCRFVHFNSTEGANFAAGGDQYYILLRHSIHNDQMSFTYGIVEVYYSFSKQFCQGQKRKGIESRMLDSAIKELEDEFKKRQQLTTWELWNQGLTLQLMDVSLSDSCDPEEVKRCIHIGLLCVEHYADDRQTMSNIISLLKNDGAIVVLPRRPAFYLTAKLSSRTEENIFQRPLQVDFKMVFCKHGASHLLLVFRYLGLWLWLSTYFHVIAAFHSLKPGEKLNSTSELCSDNRKYCMGFENINSNIYLPTYCAKSNNFQIVWVANRNQPLEKDSGSVLSLDLSGVLKIESNSYKKSHHPLLFTSTIPQHCDDVVGRRQLCVATTSP
ncbi:hypothetical protein VNO78_06665 [Psophocarpus tetragonolobus]|uniref:Bulb-type lectin domain-containing protein n=1 Tax=Psophocarpus tetragonolobus TaxID=3891 RepID=A0AAN9XRQ7_PSOTE